VQQQHSLSQTLAGARATALLFGAQPTLLPAAA
jgi:hypothetical protein